jgi:hypothetical protein
MIDDLFKSSEDYVPEAVTSQLEGHFPHCLNVEWSTIENDFEAIFYVDEIEHIARISAQGKLIEYKKNLKFCDVPSKIKTHCEPYGEIMSAIFICSNATKKYEIITQRPLIIRSLLIFSEEGSLLELRGLPAA